MSDPRPRTLVGLADRLPLTCTKEGVCCRGHRIQILPWELARLARLLGRTPREVRDACTEHGIRLAIVSEESTFRCIFADHPEGCSVHAARPLPCRLFPLARQRVGADISWYHPGSTLPCLTSCPTVVNTPPITVGAWLETQDLEVNARASDAVGDLVAGLLALVDQLGGSQQSTTTTQALVDSLGAQWYDLVTIPEVDEDDPHRFAAEHGRMLALAATKDPERAATHLGATAALLALAAGITLSQR